MLISRRVVSSAFASLRTRLSRGGLLLLDLLVHRKQAIDDGPQHVLIEQSAHVVAELSADRPRGCAGPRPIICFRTDRGKQRANAHSFKSWTSLSGSPDAQGHRWVPRRGAVSAREALAMDTTARPLITLRSAGFLMHVARSEWHYWPSGAAG
jgi:hypothetical protein